MISSPAEQSGPVRNLLLYLANVTKELNFRIIFLMNRFPVPNILYGRNMAIPSCVLRSRHAIRFFFVLSYGFSVVLIKWGYETVI
jgi:hypothetical protein